jgi:TolB-like protein/Flp pilus assembly protein TadD
LYVAGAWLLVQVVTQILPLFEVPAWSLRWVVIACVIGFPFWIAFAWFFAWTPQGFRREDDVERDPDLVHSTGRRLDFAIIGVLLIAVVLLASGYFVKPHSPGEAENSVTPAKSIAVLPFENLSNDTNNAYFVAGMQDLILTKLAGIGSLKVISRTSTEKYKSRPENLKKVAAELGVATILEGSVQRQGDMVLVNVQLIDARSDTHLWAQSYTRTLDNVFGVEGEVAGQIATALSATLSPAQSAQLASVPTTNRAAYDAFLQAEYAYNQTYAGTGNAGFKTAIALYRQAVTKDPDFALAFARLSHAESYLAYLGGAGEDIAQLKQKARLDAERALVLQPNLALARLAVGYCDYYGNRDYEAALKTFTAVLAELPNDADALLAQAAVQRRSGRIDASIDSLSRAVTLDPRNFQLSYELGNTYMMLGRYAQAEQAYQRALALQPDSVSARSQYASAITFGSGDIPRALAQLQGEDSGLQAARVTLLTYQRKFDAAIAQLQAIPDNSDNFAPGNSRELNLGLLYWQAGDKTRAGELFGKALTLDRPQIGQTQGIAQIAVLTTVATEEIGSGQIEAGLATTAKAEALLDHSRDALRNPNQMLFCAMAYAMADRADRAIPLLTKVLATAGSGLHYSPVLLWLDPAWDPIRHDAGFQALMQQYVKFKPVVTYDHAPAH